MCGAPVTSGLSDSHGLAAASGICSTSRPRIVNPQNALSRGVCGWSYPRFALNHCRSASTKLTSDTGVPVIAAASRTRSSNAASGGVSSTSYARRSASRSASLSGSGAFGMAVDPVSSAASPADPAGRIAVRLCIGLCAAALQPNPPTDRSDATP